MTSYIDLLKTPKLLMDIATQHGTFTQQTVVATNCGHSVADLCDTDDLKDLENVVFSVQNQSDPLPQNDDEVAAYTGTIRLSVLTFNNPDVMHTSTNVILSYTDGALTKLESDHFSVSWYREGGDHDPRLSGQGPSRMLVNTVKWEIGSVPTFDLNGRALMNFEFDDGDSGINSSEVALKTLVDDDHYVVRAEDIDTLTINGTGFHNELVMFDATTYAATNR